MPSCLKSIFTGGFDGAGSNGKRLDNFASLVYSEVPLSFSQARRVRSGLLLADALFIHTRGFDPLQGYYRPMMVAAP